MSLVTVKGEGSYCMTTDCSTTGTGLSLYLRVCCVNNNLGQTVHMRENNSNKHILCPPVRPRSCPPPAPGKWICNNNNTDDNNLIFYKDCKSWFDGGYNTSGVYTINPNEQTPFEVNKDITVLKHKKQQGLL